MADSVNLTSKRPHGKSVTKKISNVNPKAAESDVALFMAHLANLSDNTLQNIEKVVAQDVEADFQVDNAGLATAFADSIQVHDWYTTSRRSGRDVPTAIQSPENFIYAGAGNDSITVGAEVAGMSIIGARGNDSIQIDGHLNGGNVYKFSQGDGKDSITGWDCDLDTLQVYSDTYQVSLNADASKFYICFGSARYIQFNGLEPGKDFVKVSVEGGDMNKVYVPRLMLGTTSNNRIYNLSTGTICHGGTSTADAWTINAQGGNDTVWNDQDFVSISGGAGIDSIYNSGDSVSISGDTGNDTIKLVGASNTSVIVNLNLGNEGTDFIWGFNQDSDTFVCLNSDATISHTIFANYTSINFTDAQNTSNTNTCRLYGVAGGNIRVKIADNEVQLYNLGGD